MHKHKSRLLCCSNQYNVQKNAVSETKCIIRICAQLRGLVEPSMHWVSGVRPGTNDQPSLRCC